MNNQCRDQEHIGSFEFKRGWTDICLMDGSGEMDTDECKGSGQPVSWTCQKKRRKEGKADAFTVSLETCLRLQHEGTTALTCSGDILFPHKCVYPTDMYTRLPATSLRRWAYELYIDGSCIFLIDFGVQTACKLWSFVQEPQGISLLSTNVFITIENCNKIQAEDEEKEVGNV